MKSPFLRVSSMLVYIVTNVLSCFIFYRFAMWCDMHDINRVGNEMEWKTYDTNWWEVHVVCDN